MKTGISIYLSQPAETIERVVAKAAKSGASYAFTSLHVPEDAGDAYRDKVRWLFKLASDAGIGLIADIGPETCDVVGVRRLEDLACMGLACARLDYGFSPSEVAHLSDAFRIVFNASTVSREEITAWRHAGADLSRFAACHNFYPKPMSGLALADVAATNACLHAYGFETMGFVPGDAELRGPVFEGLPTLEAQRSRRADIALNMLELAYGADCDVVMVGDPDLSCAGWEAFTEISQGYISVGCDIDPAYGCLHGQVHHDRLDSSALVFRSQESRAALRPAGVAQDGSTGKERSRGSIAVSNTGYGRYEGELEIARADLPGDARMNVVGTLDEEGQRLLPFIKRGFGLRFS